MTKLFVSALILVSGSSAFATVYSDRNACVNYMNSAFSGASADTRLSNALLAMNLTFELKLTEKDFAQVETLVAEEKLSQDSLEKMAYFGCTEDVTANDRQIAQDSFAFILK